MPRRSRSMLLLACCGVVALSACGGSGPDATPATATSSTTDGGSGDGPSRATTSVVADGVWDTARVDATFGPALERLGLRVTRAGRSAGNGGVYGAAGSHFAVYVAPIAPATPDQYVERIAPLAQIFLPSVFDRIPDIESFDVCQEPFAADGNPPPPLTQVLVERRSRRSIPWSTLRLEDLVAASRATPNRAVLVVRGEAATAAAWAAASRS